MQSNATPQLVPDNTPLELLLITYHAVNVPLAHGQLKFQMLPEQDASTDHSLTAQTADRDNLMTDTHVLPAQPDQSRIQTTKEHAIKFNALDNMISNYQSTHNHVEDAVNNLKRAREES